MTLKHLLICPLLGLSACTGFTPPPTVVQPAIATDATTTSDPGAPLRIPPDRSRAADFRFNGIDEEFAVHEPGLPRGRSFVPTAGEWASAAALPVTGDIDTGCTLQTQREWVRLQCPSRSRYDNYRHLMLGPGVTPATMVLTANDTLAVVTPGTAPADSASASAPSATG